MDAARRGGPVHEGTSDPGAAGAAGGTSGHVHVLRVTDWTESLRDHLGSIQDADLQMQSNHTNEVMRRLAAYAAIFAAGTAITGFYGMNVLFPQVQSSAGAVTASALLAAVTIGLIAWFRRNRWL